VGRPGGDPGLGLDADAVDDQVAFDEDVARVIDDSPRAFLVDVRAVVGVSLGCGLRNRVWSALYWVQGDCGLRMRFSGLTIMCDRFVPGATATVAVGGP
jgi:hypothetical protein